MNRKQRRAAKKKNKDSTQTISEQVSLFHKLPDQCSACDAPFDKKNKKMAMCWSVVVREQNVNLFCPVCIRKTQEALKNIGESNGKKQNESRQQGAEAPRGDRETRG